jgi:hypothetical protein
MTLLIFIGLAIVGPALLAFIFAVYQNRNPAAELWKTFSAMYFFYVQLGAPIWIGLYLLYLVLVAFLAPAVHRHQ